MSNIPSVDLSFENLMSGLRPQFEYTRTKYTSRIMDVLQLIRDLKDVPTSEYRGARPSCQNKVRELREEISNDEKSLNDEKKDLDKQIEYQSKRDWKITSGQVEGPPNGRDHQIIKNLLEGALQKRSEKFEGVGMIRIWSLITDGKYLDMLIMYLEPGHCMSKSRIKPVIRERYRGVARD